MCLYPAHPSDTLHSAQRTFYGPGQGVILVAIKAGWLSWATPFRRTANAGKELFFYHKTEQLMSQTSSNYSLVILERALPWKKGVCVELRAGFQSGSLCYKASTSLGMWSRNFCRRFMWITHCLMLRVRQLRHAVLNILVHMNFNHYLLEFKRKK